MGVVKCNICLLQKPHPPNSSQLIQAIGLIDPFQQHSPYCDNISCKSPNWAELYSTARWFSPLIELLPLYRYTFRQFLALWRCHTNQIARLHWLHTMTLLTYMQFNNNTHWPHPLKTLPFLVMYALFEVQILWCPLIGFASSQPQARL